MSEKVSKSDTPWLPIIGGVLVIVVLVGWGIKRLITGLFPDDPKPVQIVKMAPTPRREHITKYEHIVIQPAKNQKRTKPVERPWVGKKPNLPSHEELMRRVKAQRTYAADLPKVPPAGSAHYRIKRSALKEWLSKPLAESGARWEPSYHRGRPKGMKVRDIQPGTFLARLGLYKDDILMSVNGRQVLSPGHAHKRYKNVASRSRNLTLEFQRGGKTYIVDFDLK